VNSSTFVNNSVTGISTAQGGAIVVAGGTTTVNNSTFFGNSAPGAGGAIAAAEGNELTINNSTIDGNSAGTSGTGGIGIDLGTIKPSITNSIVSGNTGGDCAICSTTAGNLINAGTPALGPLQYNGGPTPMMLPSASDTGIIGLV
jgi:trimeric autotransporter adhesin